MSVMMAKNEKMARILCDLNAISVTLPLCEMRLQVKMIKIDKANRILAIDERVVENEDVLRKQIRDVLSRATTWGDESGKGCLMLDAAVEIQMAYGDVSPPSAIAKVFKDVGVTIFSMAISDQGRTVARTDVNYVQLCNGLEDERSRNTAIANRSALVIAKFGIPQATLHRLEDELEHLRCTVLRVKDSEVTEYVRRGLADLNSISINKHIEKEKVLQRCKGAVSATMSYAEALSRPDETVTIEAMKDACTMARAMLKADVKKKKKETARM
jgi:hypothetical protein